MSWSLHEKMQSFVSDCLMLQQTKKNCIVWCMQPNYKKKTLDSERPRLSNILLELLVINTHTGSGCPSTPAKLCYPVWNAWRATLPLKSGSSSSCTCCKWVGKAPCQATSYPKSGPKTPQWKSVTIATLTRQHPIKNILCFLYMANVWLNLQNSWRERNVASPHCVAEKPEIPPLQSRMVCGNWIRMMTLKNMWFHCHCTHAWCMYWLWR